MKSNKPNFNKALFWDTDYNSIDFKKHARFVIEKVLTGGNLNDWNELNKLYKIDKIKEEVVKNRHLVSLRKPLNQLIINIMWLITSLSLLC